MRTVWGEPGRGHPVFIGPGALDVAGALWPRPKARAFLVEDERAGELHGEALRASLAGRVEILGSAAIAPGEASKSLAEAERVLRTLAAAGVQRSDVLVALGGGVVGDLAGFCAASYQRGVAWVEVPTTLVAQVDSAYGGKTGVDLPEGKNYVGAFHQPPAVFTDPQTLTTLPAPELAVALGLLVALELSERALGLDSSLQAEVRALLEREGLPTTFEGPPTEVLMEHAARDKKRRGERRNLVLLRRPGDVATQVEVESG